MSDKCATEARTMAKYGDDYSVLESDLLFETFRKQDGYESIATSTKTGKIASGLGKSAEQARMEAMLKLADILLRDEICG